VDAQVSLVKAQTDRIKAESRDRLLVIVLGFIFLMAVAGGSFALVATGHPVGGGSLGAGGLAAIVAALVAMGRRGSQRDDEK